MTHEQIIALTPGPELDQAVFVSVFGGIGKPSKFSTLDSAASKILERLPLFVGRVEQSHPRFDMSRQWVAGTLQWNPDIKGDMTALRVTAPTRQVALCKAALIVVSRPIRPERTAPRQSSAEEAREVAARVGTPAARNPNRMPQPTTRAHARQSLPKMPPRPDKFVAPKPVETAGRPTSPDA